MEKKRGKEKSLVWPSKSGFSSIDLSDKIC
jgi:hypothetical protein